MYFKKQLHLISNGWDALQSQDLIVAASLRCCQRKGYLAGSQPWGRESQHPAKDHPVPLQLVFMSRRQSTLKEGFTKSDSAFTNGRGQAECHPLVPVLGSGWPALAQPESWCENVLLSWQPDTSNIAAKLQA